MACSIHTAHEEGNSSGLLLFDLPQSNKEYKYTSNSTLLILETATQRYILGASIGKIAEFPCTVCTDMENYIQFMSQRCQKYASHQKKLQINIVRKWSSCEKGRERIGLSPPRVEMGALKDWHVRQVLEKLEEFSISLRKPSRCDGSSGKY